MSISAYTTELNIFSGSDGTGKGCNLGFDAQGNAQLFVQADATDVNADTTGDFRFNGDVLCRLAYNGASESSVQSVSGFINQAKSERDTEAVDRANGDNTLQSNLDNEEARAIAAELANLNRVTAEAATARAAESANAAAIATETVDRQTADTQHDNDLTAEVTRAQGAESGLSTSIANEIVRAQAAELVNANGISDEEQRAQLAEAANATNLSNYEQSNDAALAQEVSDRAAAVTALQTDVDTKNSARIAGISTVNDKVDDEIADRAAADTNLQNQIDNIVSNTDPAALDSLTEIVTQFQADDASLTALAATNLGYFETWVDDANYRGGDSFTTQMTAVVARLSALETTIANLQGS